MANPQTPAGNPNFSGNPAQLKSTCVRNREIRLAAKKAAVTAARNARHQTHDAALNLVANSTDLDQ
jgi:hypothetical protein